MGPVAVACSHDWTRLEAFAVHHRGKVLFDQREFAALLADFKAAVALRERMTRSTDELESSMIAVAIVESFIDEE